MKTPPPIFRRAWSTPQAQPLPKSLTIAAIERRELPKVASPEKLSLWIWLGVAVGAVLLGLWRLGRTICNMR